MTSSRREFLEEIGYIFAIVGIAAAFPGIPLTTYFIAEKIDRKKHNPRNYEKRGGLLNNNISWIRTERVERQSIGWNTTILFFLAVK